MRAFENVKKQIDEVERHNKKYDDEEASFKMRCNSRADLTVEEKQAFMNGLALSQQESENIKNHKLRVQAKANTVRQASFPPAPPRLDYRELGYVTEVVDQGGSHLIALFMFHDKYLFLKGSTVPVVTPFRLLELLKPLESKSTGYSRNYLISR